MCYKLCNLKISEARIRVVHEWSAQYTKIKWPVAVLIQCLALQAGNCAVEYCRNGLFKAVTENLTRRMSRRRARMFLLLSLTVMAECFSYQRSFRALYFSILSLPRVLFFFIYDVSSVNDVAVCLSVHRTLPTLNQIRNAHFSDRRVSSHITHPRVF